MKRFSMGALALAFCLSGTLAQGQGLSLGTPGYGGPGCPDGTARVSLNDDGTQLRLSFERFQAAAGGGSGRSFDRKSCNLSIPVSVPSGKSVSVISVQYRGFNRLPASATSRISVETFLAGGSGPVVSRSFTGPLQDAFTFSERGTATAWSACGADVILRINASLRVNASGSRAASIGVRRQDVSTGLVYRLRWRDC